MEKIQLYETFSGEVTFHNQDSLMESGDYSASIDGVDIIGIVEGQFFQPDGMSRNKRWYSRKLWENALASADVRTRLANRTMYGEIGHSDGPVTDMTLREGSVSHIIADLWIDEKGRGMGRAYIINTEKGRLLKTYLGAKSKLKVSTRGEGSYLDGQVHDGCPIIDPDSYELQTVDFVLNPGFMETSARLTTQKEDYTPETKQVNEETTNKEGETQMALDMDKYVQKLEDKVATLEAKNESLSKELASKEKELLESKFVESAEIKKINEAYAPFKKMGVSAKSLNETLKRSQTALQTANKKNAKLTEELSFYQDKCGSKEQVEEALGLYEKALKTIAEYQELGSVADLKGLMQKSEALIPQLAELKKLSEYKELGSVEDLKALAENCEKSLPRLKEFSLLEDYKKLGTVEDIKGLASKCESIMPRLAELNEAERLARNVKKLMPQLEEMQDLKKAAKRAYSVIEQYMQAVGSVKEAKALVESRKATIKKVNAREALEISNKFGCTIESAAKLLKKYGKDRASQVLTEALAKRKPAQKKLTESKKLVEESQLMDGPKVNAKPETKDAKDFLKTGMIVNGFNREALGKEIKPEDLNKLDGTKVDGANQAKALLKAYQDKVEVEKAPKTEPEKTPAEAEKLAKQLIK